MKPYKELSKDNKDGLKEILLNMDLPYDDANAEKLYNELDQEHRFNIHYWGSDETCTREQIFEWAKDNFKPNGCTR